MQGKKLLNQKDYRIYLAQTLCNAGTLCNTKKIKAKFHGNMGSAKNEEEFSCSITTQGSEAR